MPPARPPGHRRTLRAMGMTYANVDLRDLSGTGPAYSARFLADTGAVECLAPRDELLAVNVAPAGTKTYELADGTAAELEYGFARVTLLGGEAVTSVVFADPGTEPILGVIVMEALGLVFDPNAQTLKRLKAIPLK